MSESMMLTDRSAYLIPLGKSDNEGEFVTLAIKLDGTFVLVGYEDHEPREYKASTVQQIVDMGPLEVMIT